jgi:(R,R)-butanediol dehydrogenase/meso-butanediol dehydrogenase/diacetyl reductase/L-iditol 2-dehydrogenase
MSEYIVWHESQVYKLPDNVSLKEGCLLEPVSIAVRCMDKVEMKLGQRVAICGGGPIGLLVLQGIKMMGATYLTLIEPVAARRELALKYGAENVIAPQSQSVVEEAMRITGNRGYDVVIECSGSIHAVEALPEITARGGKLIYAAMYPNEYEMPLNLYNAFFSKEITITGMYVAPYAYPRAMQIMPRMKLEDFTAAVYSMDRAQEAFEAHISAMHPKVLIKCNDFPGE